ncbi:hypothetical protein ALC62_06331, partial [Cyphomyrmex costatus]
AKMFLILTGDNIINDLTAEQLQFIPKIILLREFSNHIDYLWDKLPEYIKRDPEVRGYRRCLEHYNLSTQQSHIYGPTPLIKDCCKCKTIWASFTNVNYLIDCETDQSHLLFSRTIFKNLRDIILIYLILMTCIICIKDLISIVGAKLNSNL